MTASAFVAGSRKARQLAPPVLIAIVAALAALMLWLGFGRLRSDLEHPFGIKRIHIPPPAQTVRQAPPPVTVVDEVRNLRSLNLQAQTMTWSETVSVKKKTFGYTYSSHTHRVTLSGTVPMSDDVSGLTYSVSAPNLLVYWLPAPTAGTPAVDPASEIPYDSCHIRLPVVFLSLSQSCAPNLLGYQTAAIASFKATADQPASINAARAQAGSVLACLLAPTGWGLDIQWTDQPPKAAYSPLRCSTPPGQRLTPASSTTTVTP